MHCLSAWDRKKGSIGPLVDAVIHGSAMGPSDRHLAVNLVQGVLRQMQYLDAVISRFAKLPPRKMKSLTLMTLRVAVYQIIFLDRIPDSAAVNEAVKAMRQERQPRWLLNFVNGVLRNVVRNRHSLIPSGEGDGESILNHPGWLVDRWRQRYGRRKAEKICRRNNREPLLTLRVNTLRTGTEELAELFRRQGLGVRPGSFAPHSLVLDAFSGSVAGLPGYGEGLFHVQDEAAQLATYLLGPFMERGLYLDGCAGLGGKTCQLAQLLPPGTALAAVEPDHRRASLLEENRLRLRLADITLFHGSLADFRATGPGLFTGVLIDAPCSGTGVIRRHPDIRWNRQPGDLPVYQARQIELLEQGAPLVRPGGILVYATCSIEAEENEEVIRTFLSGHAEFTATDCRPLLPAAAAELVTAEGHFSSTPADGMDGFFAARLVHGDLPA